MPLQNRVTPFGNIIATSARGGFMGNRGILHSHERILKTEGWTHTRWIVCRLSFKDRRRSLMAPGHYTELFFLDEAVALAAGHRPCGECRRADLLRFKGCWHRTHGGAVPGTDEIDRVLHGARVRPRAQGHVSYAESIDALPDGTFVVLPATPGAYLVAADLLFPYAPEGYGRPLPRPSRIDVEVLTPRPTVATLTAGYRPDFHPSAVSRAIR